MSLLEDLQRAIDRVNADMRVPEPHRHLVHPADFPRLLPWERCDEAVDWVLCADLCGTYLPLGPVTP